MQPKARLGSEDRVFKPYPLSEVTIVGMGDSVDSYLQNVYNSPGKKKEGHEVWTINSGCLVFAHDLVFNMHDLDELEKKEPAKKFKEAYLDYGRPVVTTRALSDVPNTFEYPLAEVVEKFSEIYFANGITYMVAFAMLCGVKRINLFGCDFNYSDGRTLYEAGRCNLEYWLGYAKASGVVISVPINSCLMDVAPRMTGNGAIGYGSIYGYFDQQPIIKFDDAGYPAVAGFSTPPIEFEKVDNAVDNTFKKLIDTPEDSVEDKADAS